MITLTDIAYVRSGVADLDTAVRFATDIVGLELAAPTEIGVAHLRADARHHCLALVEGPLRGDLLRIQRRGLRRARRRARPSSSDPASRSAAARPQQARSRRVRDFIALRRPVREPPRAGEPAGDGRPARRLHPRRRDHRVRPPLPGRAGRARGLPVLEHPLQRAGVGLDRRRGLPDADRPGPPQARRLPRRRAGPVPHELPGGDDRRRVPQLALPRRPRRRDRDGPGTAPAVDRDLPLLPRARRASPTSTPSASGASRTTRRGRPRTFDPDEPGSIDMWLGPIERVATQPQLQSLPVAGRTS